jgi:tRNA A-37 threonylcarbamoyl transferase component Bud32
MSDESLYDAYLDACLAGEVEEPASFFQRHPEAGEELRARVETLYRSLIGADDDELPFDRLGEFKLLRRLDSGGMGSVYVAEQDPLGRIVALKILRPELVGSSEAALRFEREAHAVAQLRHDNIVTVHAAGEVDGVRYLAMEMVEGRRLDDLLGEVAAGREAVDTERIVRWIADLARALDYAHARGIVHRDVKPSNVRVTPDDRPLLIDFGIAHVAGGQAATLTRNFAGSPTYAAPEQITGDAVDGRTDVYALGVTLYQCLTGVVPFSSKTVEGVFHKALTEDPVPPRSLRGAVSRDLQTITLKAMEKRPDARYASAASFADDLEAALAFRPIRARPPGAFARAAKWARRRPAWAVGAGAVLFFAVAIPALLLAQQSAAAQQRRREAADMVATAARTVEAYRLERLASRQLEKQITKLQKSMHGQYFTPEQDLELLRREHEVARLRRRRAETFYGALDLLRQAERLDSEVVGADEVRARLYVEKWEEAKIANDPITQAFFRSRIGEFDHSGALTGRLATRGTVRIDSDPPGAECFLFPYRELAELRELGERRLVPVADFETPVPAGTLVRRVVGGADAGRILLEEPPEGVETRWTAAPAFLDERASIGTTPARDLELDEGTFLIVLRRAGHELQRQAFRVRGGPVEIHVRLDPIGTVPPGFVRIPAVGKRRRFLLQEREVTCAEYLAFLNAPQNLRRAGTGKRPLLVPRGPHDKPYWTRDDEGRFFLPHDWRPDFPVVGVDWFDARAYIAWKLERDGRAYLLPKVWMYEVAGGQSATGRSYPFGNVFRPKWACSNWSKPVAKIEPVLSYPVDESPYGVFDLSGSAMEWLDAWWGSGKEQRWLAGGSWGYSDPVLFKSPGGWGSKPDRTTGTYGFRLAILDSDSK